MSLFDHWTKQMVGSYTCAYLFIWIFVHNDIPFCDNILDLRMGITHSICMHQQQYLIYNASCSCGVRPVSFTRKA